LSDILVVFIEQDERFQQGGKIGKTIREFIDQSRHLLKYLEQNVRLTQLQQLYQLLLHRIALG
jgi:hypothetical protein